MKIVVFSQLFFPENATISETVKRLAARGHQVTVMTGLPNAPRGHVFSGYGFFQRLREKINGVDVLRNWLIPRGKGSAIRLALNYLSFVVSASLGLMRLYGKRPDVIFVNQLSPVTVALPALLYKLLTRRPMAMWIHDLWPESVTAATGITSPLLMKPLDAMVRFIYRHCDLVFVQSQAMFDILEERGVPRSKVRYLPNPIEDLFAPLVDAPRHPALANVPKGFIVMNAGSIGQSHDIGSIIAAADRLRGHADIHIVFVGDGRARAAAEQQVKKLGLQSTVHFLGQFASTEMPSLFAAADMMLVTLLDQPIFALTVPLRTQTYMACAKPIICTVRGEAARIIDLEGAGFAVPPESPDKLADAILKAKALTPAERLAMGQRARNYFTENFASEKLLQTLENGLQDLVVRGKKQS